MDTKPTTTLAKLYVSQEKYDYALAIYLYLQEKEGVDYNLQITEAVGEICNTKWCDYNRQIKKIFTKEEAALLHIIPEDLRVATIETLNDIENDFEGTMSEMADKLMDYVESDKKEKCQEEEAEGSEKLQNDSQPLEVDEPLIANDLVTEIENSKSLDDLPEIDPEIEKKDEEIDFPTLGEGVYKEPEIEEIEQVENKVPDKEELVPGLNDFTTNYKKDVTQGLIEENTVSSDEKLEKKLQDDMDQKLFNVLRIMRGMSAEELRRVLKSNLNGEKKLEELTLGDLEELLD